VSLISKVLTAATIRFSRVYSDAVKTLVSADDWPADSGVCDPSVLAPHCPQYCAPRLRGAPHFGQDLIIEVATVFHATLLIYIYHYRRFS
jgi:hypothetical protein